MPITEKVAKENQELYEKAMANPMKVKITGKALVKSDLTGKWELPTDQAQVQNLHPSYKDMTWGWMGKKYRLDGDGYMREVTSTGKFGGYLPEKAMIHYTGLIKTGETHDLRPHFIVEREPEKALKDLSIEELQDLAFSKGMTEKDAKGMKKADLLAFLGK
jgi:hypothetical protein